MKDLITIDKIGILSLRLPKDYQDTVIDFLFEHCEQSYTDRYTAPCEHLYSIECEGFSKAKGIVKKVIKYALKEAEKQDCSYIRVEMW